MAAKKRGLGRGLDALLQSTGAATETGAQTAAGDETLRDMKLTDLKPGKYQPRREIDPEALQSLADSIKAQGVVQPIVIRPTDDGYEIVAGERRWRAAQMAGLETIPAITREVPDETAMAVALIENIQREDLNPMEEAVALRRLIDECNLTHAQCAEAVGRSRAAVSNLLRMLELDDAVQRLVRERRLEMGHARALLPLPQDKQIAVAEKVMARALSVRQTEELVRGLLSEGAGKKPAAKTEPNPRLHGLQKSLADTLGVKVSIQQGSKGRGKLVIPYASLDELDGIVGRIK